MKWKLLLFFVFVVQKSWGGNKEVIEFIQNCDQGVLAPGSYIQRLPDSKYDAIKIEYIKVDETGLSLRRVDTIKERKRYITFSYFAQSIDYEHWYIHFSN